MFPAVNKQHQLVRQCVGTGAAGGRDVVVVVSATTAAVAAAVMPVHHHRRRRSDRLLCARVFEHGWTPVRGMHTRVLCSLTRCARSRHHVPDDVVRVRVLLPLRTPRAAFVCRDFYY